MQHDNILPHFLLLLLIFLEKKNMQEQCYASHQNEFEKSFRKWTHRLNKFIKFNREANHHKEFEKKFRKMDSQVGQIY